MNSYPSYDFDEEYYSSPDVNNPWVLEKEIGKGGFGLVKLYINKVRIGANNLVYKIDLD